MCVADSLMSTTRRVRLLIVHGLLHGAQVVGDMHRPHDKAERAVGFMVSTTTGTGTGGGGKGAEERTSLALLALAGGLQP